MMVSIDKRWKSFGSWRITLIRGFPIEISNPQRDVNLGDGWEKFTTDIQN
jgi:hypothetical protein